MGDPRGSGEYLLDVFGSDIEDEGAVNKMLASESATPSKSSKRSNLDDPPSSNKKANAGGKSRSEGEPSTNSSNYSDRSSRSSRVHDYLDYADDEEIQPIKRKSEKKSKKRGVKEENDDDDLDDDLDNKYVSSRRIPRRSNAIPENTNGPTSVLDGLDDDDYADEEEIRKVKRRKGSSSRKSSSSKRRDRGDERSRKSGSKRRRLDRGSDDDEPTRNDDDDNFIDDANAKRLHSDDDDVVRTKGGLEISNAIEEEEEEKPKKVLNAFEEALEKNKRMRRPRRKEVDQSKVESECLEFLQRMMAARDSDVLAYSRGQPALAKLKMLREVEAITTKVSHRECLLESMILAVIKAWLDPMPDSTLPNVQIRTVLLQILNSLRVDADWVERLKSSNGLGKVVHFLSRNEPHEPNRRLAEKLMMKWARPVYQSNSNYEDILAEYDRPEEGHRAPRDSIVADRRKTREAVKHFKSAREKLDEFKSRRDDKEQILAPIPRPANFLYTALAEGSAQVNESLLRENRSAAATSRKVNRTMSKMRHLNKNRTARAAKPSVNGR